MSSSGALRYRDLDHPKRPEVGDEPVVVGSGA